MTSVATGAVGSTVTTGDGRYSFAAPGGERHELRVRRIGYYALVVEVAFPPGALHVEQDLRLTPSAVAIAPLEVRTVRPVGRPLAPRTPGGQDLAEHAALLLNLPVQPGDLNGVAALHPGVFSLGGDRGVVMGGQPPSQSSTTLDGASYGATSLPSEALASAAVITSTFDPARGQFSGGQIAATTLSGTNLFGGAARFRFSDPALQAAVPSQETGLLGASGGAGGALVPDRFFWYGAGEVTRRWDPLLTLDNADSGAMRELGIDAGAAQRLRGIVGSYPRRPELPGAKRHQDLATGLLRLDYLAHDDHVLMVRGDFRSRVAGSVGEQPFALSGSGVELRDRSGGALAQLTSFFGDARNELRLSARESGQDRTPYLSTPTGEVLVRLAGEGGESGSTRLRFGPGTFGEGTSSSSLLEASDELAFSIGERHRVKLGFLANRESAARSGAANTSGTFSFASLADLEAGRPSAFSRTLGQRTGRAESEYLALFAGHLWQPRGDLRMIYGLRVEGRRYPRPGEDGSDPAPLFGLVPGSIPSEWGVSPRVGFSYDPPGAKWDLRGGVGEFRGKLPVSALADARGESGTPGATRLLCLGAAAPRPDWDRFLASPGEIPEACSDGQAYLASNLPRTTLFENGLGAPRTWRAQLSWNWSGALPVGYLGLNAEAGWARGLSQPLARDRNFAALAGFSLPDEAGRAVYVPASGIDPASGSIGLAPSRLDPTQGTVRLVSGRGRSTVADFKLTAYLWTSGLRLVYLNYTYTRARDEVGEMSAPWQFSAPLSPGVPGGVVRGVSDLERRHLLQAQYTQPFRRWPGEVGIVARLASGQPYTPQVDRDVNGDGLANDPAFVFDPGAVRDSTLRAGLEGLLSGSSDVRSCLREQLRRIAARNSCRGPWTADFDVQASFWPRQERVSRRLTLSVDASNLLAGLDRTLHGPSGLRGWGRMRYPDPVLLYVRGFEPGSRAFRYEVNRNFGGAADGELLFGQPFTLTLQARWTFGTDPVRQPLLSRVAGMRATGRTAREVRTELARTVPNLAAQVLALDDTLRLGLSEDQKERLRAQADSFGVRLAPVVDSLAAAVEADETSSDPRAAREARTRKAVLARDAQAVLDAAGQALRGALTREQWQRLPLAIQQPASQILSDRKGFRTRGSDW